MAKRLAGVALVVATFVAGVLVGSTGFAGLHPATMTGDGMVGEQVATLWSGDTAYGAKSSLQWRDATGAEHEDGWPDCLSAPGSVTGIRFAGAMVWHAGLGQATILWVDCSSA